MWIYEINYRNNHKWHKKQTPKYNNIFYFVCYLNISRHYLMYLVPT